MATDKKSFLLYCDLIHTVEHLTDEEAGQLLKHILSYVNDEQPVTDVSAVKIAFEPVRQALKRDLIKYKSIREKRSKAGHESAKKRAEKSTNSTSVDSAEQGSTNSTVNESVSVMVNGNAIDTVINKEVVNFFEKSLQWFPEKTRPKTKAQVEKWLDTIDKLTRLDKYTFTEIAFIIKWARQDDFWSTNFLSILKLRKTNKEGVKYIDVFSEKCKPKAGIKNVQQKGDDMESWFGTKSDKT